MRRNPRYLSSESIYVRVPARDKATWAEAAKRERLSLSGWAVIHLEAALQADAIANRLVRARTASPTVRALQGAVYLNRALAGDMRVSIRWAKNLRDEMRESPLRPNKKRTAYHEAGHAVAALVLGLPIRRVTIVPNRSSAGHLVYRPTRAELPDMGIRYLIADLAGFAAQHRHNPTHGATPFLSINGDCKNALAKAAKAAPDEPAVVVKYLKSASAGAETLIANRWGCVRRVAQALLKRRTLTGAQVGELVGRRS